MWQPSQCLSVGIVDAVKSSRNELEIDVINLWSNRIIDAAALQVEKRFTRSNISMDPQTPLVESGLLRPVSLQVAQKHVDPP